MSIFCLVSFLYLFKYGLVSGVILVSKICYSLKFLKFRPFTLFFYKHCKHTSCRHYLMFLEFWKKSFLWKEKDYLPSIPQNGKRDRCIDTKRVSAYITFVHRRNHLHFFEFIASKKRAKGSLLKSRCSWKNMLIMHNLTKSVSTISLIYMQVIFLSSSSFWLFVKQFEWLGLKHISKLISKTLSIMN